jgi:hypothetical protein
VLLDNPFAHPQSKAGALLSLGGEEGLKDSGGVVFRDSFSVVGD